MSFVTGSGGTSDHFRAVKRSDHSEECYLQRVNEEAAEKTNYNEVVEGALDDKGIRNRVMYLYRKLNNPKKKTPRKTQKPRKKSSSSGATGISVVLGGKDPTSIDEIKERGQKVSVRVPSRELNQLSPSDAGKIFQLAAPIKKVKKKGNSFQLSLSLGNHKATLVTTEAFFKGSNDPQVRDYLNSLSEFINNNRYEVTLFAFCMFHEYNDNETIIFANDFRQFHISVSKTQSNPRLLDSFQALYIRNVWS